MSKNRFLNDDDLTVIVNCLDAVDDLFFNSRHLGPEGKEMVAKARKLRDRICSGK